MRVKLSISYQRILLLCFGYLALQSNPVFAKESQKDHPVKKVDVRPNDDDNDIWTFSLESNTYQASDFLSPTLDFSAQDGWDVQIAAYSIPLSNQGGQNTNWDSTLNLSKTFIINDYFKTLIGTQNGTTLFANSQQWHHFDYDLLIVQPLDSLNVHAGAYWANKVLTGTTNVVGFTAGFSYECIPNTLTLQGDYFSGHASVSGAIVNVFYQLFSNTQIYTGIGIPETNSGNEFYGTLGFSVASKPN